MTDRELFEKALEALENFARFQRMMMDGPDVSDKLLAEDYAEAGFLQGAKTITALRERLAQPIIKNYLEKDNSAQPQRTHWEGCEEVHPECRQQEPVAWVTGWHDGHCVIRAADPALMLPIGAALYTAPQRREWVGLTDEELAEFSEAKLGAYDLCLEVEAKLKEKNT